ncbi:hypothetical protein DFJ74DRAFT_665369 [Hyaloraphidium curvatum]|nr:hypothetical protein DFJ74DRAFT_665369 [Hyaloraphidium curvatum]
MEAAENFSGFTEAERLALFPAPTDAPFSFWPADAAPTAPRTAPPLTAADMLSALRPFPALARELRWQLAVAPWSRRVGLGATLACATMVPVLAVLWTFNDGLFATASLVAITVLSVVGYLVVPVLTLVFLLARGGSKTTAVPPPGPDQHPLPGMVRWLQLAALRGPAGVEADTEAAPDLTEREASPLVRHLAGDTLCPCTEAACAGRLPVRAAWERRLVDRAENLAYYLVVVVFSMWTPIFTWGARTWSTPWSAVVLALFVLYEIDFQFIRALVSFEIGWNILNLQQRLHTRAMAVCLASFLARYRAALSSPEALDPARQQEPFFALHRSLSAAYRTRLQQLDRGRLITRSMGTLTVFQAVVLLVRDRPASRTGRRPPSASQATGSCVTLWNLTGIAISVFSFAKLLLLTAASNAQVAGLSTLLHSARQEARSLLARHRRTASAAVLAALEDQERVLGSLGHLEGWKSRVLGLAVDFGAVRAFLAAVFTVAFGLWSVLRGLGVFFTVESTCPIVR